MIPGSANPLLLASAAEATGYQIERSLRFNSDDSAYLGDTFGTPTDQDVFTLSMWVKRSALGGTQQLFGVSTNHSFGFTPGDALNLTFGGSSALTTTALFRDPSAWYHIMWVQNGTSHTLYVNGISVGTATEASNTFNTAVAHQIGAGNTTNFFNGYLAYIHFIDGQAKPPSAFGTDDANGIWQPIEYTGTYGTNGFHLNFADNSTDAALGADTSGNGNDWTVNNINANSNGAVYGTGNLWNTSTKTVDTASYHGTSTSPYILDITGNYNTNPASFAYTGTIDNLFDGTDSVAYLTNDYVNLSVYSFLVDLRDFLPVTSVSIRGYALNGSIGGFYYTPYKAQLLDASKNLISGSTITLVTTMADNTVPVSGTPRYLQIFRYGGTYDRAFIAGFDINGTRMVNAKLPQDVDSFVDVPTNGTETDTGVGGEVRGNYCTWNPLWKMYSGTFTTTNGNLEAINNTNSFGYIPGTFYVSSGKWYWEVFATGTVSSTWDFVGLVSTNSNNSYPGNVNDAYWYRPNGNKVSDTGYTGTSYGASWVAGNIIGVALDMDAGNLTFYKNGTSQGVAFSGLSNEFGWSPAVGDFSNPVTLTSWVGNFGQRPFAYTAPSGYKALCTANLPSTTITTSGSYTGNGVADGPFVYLNGVPTAMTIGGNSVTFGTDADKLSNGFKIRTTSTAHNQNAFNYNYTITSTGDPFKTARAQSN